ncbi:2-hydroxyacid dehydrogenase [Sulfolobus acidocaldarius]|uniref:D-isomer specific 2-hydroxyacid dehydrogenase n=3 Tax=Sulfolobus acidocaldarius TaxID=2285 RepID=Q4JC15_SULAC|nr:2-hydroxyacid dehydrogenase [Sulfolobus acidocaldarius]AAY79664.1 D-isomer specific 2-hydroxyacid dehydrogenase [Sulfolobus acidocaldarius DSM 639]AGE72497.1 D-isomer specific 2-hydroxyacid dehydrogenase [Sulfolobus acidocaldarius Ron12/I]ALU29370.1 3-phosphoglycerate dehydrogenase [Sulfolobus acidocaldarius]ALU32099.1 3-phosphoglycerate dehydrogenase [Sulfolobus acidocaldarius]WCM34239.1 3-phosphoglycerate dehydrogenase [Sulfolobus acidocaldarius DSM 639]
MLILSTEKLPDECKRLLPNARDQFNEDDVPKADILMLWPLQAKVFLPKAKSVKAVQTFSAGVDDFPFSLLPKGVDVFSNAGAYSVSVAEHAFALIMTLAKGIGKRDRTFRPYPLTGVNLMVLGGGGIGSEVARIGKMGFNMYVIGVSRSFKRPELFDEKHNISELKDIIGKADIIVDTLPLTKLTDGILNYDMLSRVKENAIIVNVGRGETVVEEDVYRLLKERKDVRFGTDVFWRKNGVEDFNSKLWELDNFTGTPHTGGAYGNDVVKTNAIIEACKNVYNYITSGKAENKVRIEDYL